MVRISNLDLIRALKENSRITNTELARRFGVTETAIRKRIKKLEQEGTIKGYTVEVDHKKLGMEIAAMIGIDTSPESYLKVIEKLKRMEEVCCLRSSSGDHMILADCWFRDSAALNRFMKRIERTEGVTRTCPAVITDRIK